MNKKSAILLASAIVLFAGAAFRFRHFMDERSPSDENAFFYDLSERKLFVAPRTRVPPIRGINDDTADGMRAVVISTSGNPKDKANRKIAYLEKYAPELKQQLEGMQTPAEQAGPAGMRISRGAAQSLTFVRRLQEEAWHPVNSPEGEKILTEWQAPGPDGQVPVLCVP